MPKVVICLRHRWLAPRYIKLELSFCKFRDHTAHLLQKSWTVNCGVPSKLKTIIGLQLLLSLWFFPLLGLYCLCSLLKYTVLYSGDKGYIHRLLHYKN